MLLLVKALMILETLVSVALIAAVLLQQSEGDAMSGLGGGSANGTVGFGGRATGVEAIMARITIFLASVFALLALVITKMTM